MNVYHGVRVGHSAAVTKNGKGFSHKKSCRVWNHSPTGFEWGYHGSGPAQLALAILLEETTKDIAVELHQRFKRTVISQLDRDLWRLDGDDVRRWLALANPSCAGQEWKPLFDPTDGMQ